MRHQPDDVAGLVRHPGDVLEIGPGNDPFPVAPGARVRYADRSVEGGRDKNWPELVGLPHGPAADFNINLDVDGLAAIPSDSLDVVVACHVIEHLANPITALREFERANRHARRATVKATLPKPKKSLLKKHVDYYVEATGKAMESSQTETYHPLVVADEKECKGQPLAAIYSPELVAAQQEYLLARRAEGRLAGSAVPGVATGGNELAEAARQRLRYWDVSAGDIATLEKTGEPRRTVTLHSPVSGVVVDKPAVEGMRVGPSDRLFEITDLSRVWVLAELYEKDLGLARVGVPAEITLQSAPGIPLHGHVSFVSPVLKPETRTLEVRIEVDNAAGTLKPEMLADVYLEGPRSTTLTVPESALIFTGERTLVFLDRGEGRFEPREVTLGTRVPGGYEALQGLAPGDRVVMGANFLLDSESSLRAAIARARH
jgi:Cu(I)/Ag(I) efflux system membrane fusion protein